MIFGRARHDRLFARFVARGDVHALGEVFDAIAPELMRIATYVVGSRELARDLVQSAFLIALEKRTEFAAERRVLPWMCGIVANLARNERRRCKREVVGELRSSGEDPVAAAEALEFRAAFARAKAALPEVYRPVLELHLEHGMNAAEIGSALGRPAGTVRTQIVRGLEVLRRQLPRGFVAGLAVVPLSAGALSATRAFVLRRAAELAPTSANAVGASGGLAWTVIGAGAVNKKLAIVSAAGVALLALGAWIAGALPGGPLTPPEVPSVPAPMSAAAGELRARATAAMPPAAAEREQVIMPSAGSAPASGSLEVSARWKHDDAPARAQAIDVIYAGEVLGELHPRRVVTDGEGRAVFETLRPGAISVQSSTGVRNTAEVKAGVRGTVKLILEGIPVHGQVVDHRGNPVADAEVWVSSELRYEGSRIAHPGHGQYGQRTLRSDAQGRFETRIQGVQYLAAFKAGHGPSLSLSPMRGTRPSPDRPVFVVLRLQAQGGGLTITVRSSRAAPVGDALVLAGPERPTCIGTGEDNLATTPALRALTDKAGVAALSLLPAVRMPVEVRAVGHGPWRGEVEIPAGGTAQLDVALIEGAVVSGVVLDGLGAPLSNALVFHEPVELLRGSLSTSDAHGAYRLESLPAGEVEVVAFHEEWGTVKQQLTLSAGLTQRWDARMPPRAAITGVVLDADGQPAGGAHLTAYAPRRHATAHADAAGQFTLSPLDPQQAYEVRAEIPLRVGVGFVIARQSAVPAGAKIELRAQADQVPTARLRGRVLQSDGTPAAGYELCTDPEDGSPGCSVPIGANGGFELGPWQPTRLRISVHKNRSKPALAEFGVHAMCAGTTVEVGDLILPIPAGVRIHITGGDAEKGVARLFRSGLPVDDRLITNEPLAWDDLPPGDYAVCVTRGGAKPLSGFAEFAVHPGRVAEVAVNVLGANRRELRFETPNGRPTGPVILRANDPAGHTVLMATVYLASSIGYAGVEPPEDEPIHVMLPDGALELHFASEAGHRGGLNVSGAGTEPIVVTLALAK